MVEQIAIQQNPAVKLRAERIPTRLAYSKGNSASLVDALTVLAQKWPEGFHATDVAELVNNSHHQDALTLREFLYPGQPIGQIVAARSVGKRLAAHMDEPVSGECTLILQKNAVDWGARPYGKNSWNGKPGFITGTSPGAIGSALAQQHLRSVMLGLGMTLQGGEAYVTFKPDLVDDDSNISDEGTRKFLQEFLNKFASLVVRLSPQDARSAA